MDCGTQVLPVFSSDALPCQARPQLWFSDRPDEVEAAKHRCGSCRLKAPCLAGALRRREPAGVWGGELLVDGNVQAGKRARGRPRRTVEPREAAVA